MGKKILRDEFEQRLKEKHPFSKLEIIEYNGLTEPLLYKCLECGENYKLNHAKEIFSRLNPCKNETPFYSRKQKIQYFESLQSDLKVINVQRVKSLIHCNNCGKDFERTTVSLMGFFDSCPYCNNRYQKQKLTKEEASQILKQKFPQHNYEIIFYNGFHQKSEIKCLDCHFHFKGNFDGFIQSRGCPRCYRKKSKGENKIEAWLENNNIQFIAQKNLDDELKRFKFDFYLPKYNYAIEYNGEQHYQEKKGRFDSLEKTQERDEIKKRYCKDKNIKLLIIPYWDYSNIESILSSTFND